MSICLIDRQSAANHRAQVFNVLYKAFSENEVIIERFYYDGDIRLCWNEGHKRGITLKELQHKYPEHRLIVVGSALSLLSPTNGKLAKWATVFDQWRTRALMSTRPPAEWDMREAQLSTKFRILPATLRGLGELVETVEAVEVKDFRLWKKVNDETAIPLNLPDTLTPDELMGILKAEFTVYHNQKADDRLLQWIAACAVYPSLHWDMTLALANGQFTMDNGQSVATDGVTPSHPVSMATQSPPLGAEGASNLVTLDNLFHINRLQWFVDGKIPEAARKILLNWLAENHPYLLEATRKNLQQILANTQPPKDSIAYEDYRLQMVINDLYLKPDAKKRKALEQELEKLLALDAEQDFLVAEYLNRKPAPLDFIVPQSLRKYVRIQDDKKLPRSKALVWQLPLFLMSALILFLFNPKAKDCSGISTYYKNINYCLNSPQDSLTLLEYMLCDTIETGTIKSLSSRMEAIADQARDSAAILKSKGMPTTNMDKMVQKIEEAKDSLLENLQNNGFSIGASPQDILFEQSYSLMKRHALDTASFYRNVGLAYWNGGVNHYKQSSSNTLGLNTIAFERYSQMHKDSACILLNILDQWSWRDSVLTIQNKKSIRRLCYGGIQSTTTNIDNNSETVGNIDNTNTIAPTDKSLGFDETFIKANDFKIDINAIIQNQKKENLVILPYHNFSVVMHKERKMALLTAVNYKSSDYYPPRANDVFILDPRLNSEYQLPNSFYAENDLDKGHLVRPIEPAWGKDAIQAQKDAYHLTNITPQHKTLNRKNWNDLENYILKQIGSDKNLTILSGPVFSENDIPYRGALIPLLFWKIIAFVNSNGKPVVTGYMVSQEDLLDEFKPTDYVKKPTPNTSQNNNQKPSPLNGLSNKISQVSLEMIANYTGLNLSRYYQYDPLAQALLAR
jgi:DNA/RNA endonuclease G (NUC1)